MEGDRDLRPRRDELLISDRRVLQDRRTLYALKALAGLRHGEAARLRWWQLDGKREPLTGLNLGKTKGGVPLSIPVHPVLRTLLTEWRDAGWERIYGRQPENAASHRAHAERNHPREPGRAARASRRSSPAPRSRSAADLHHPRAGRRRGVRGARSHLARASRRHRQRVHDLPLAGPLRQRRRHHRQQGPLLLVTLERSV